MKSSKGFSLIELLAVIAILAVLVAIAVPRYFDAVDEAKKNIQKANISMIRTALELYRHKSSDKKYPSTGDFNSFLENSEYFTEPPVCPYNNKKYEYAESAPDPWTANDAHYLVYKPTTERTSYEIEYYIAP